MPGDTDRRPEKFVRVVVERMQYGKVAQQFGVDGPRPLKRQFGLSILEMTALLDAAKSWRLIQDRDRAWHHAEASPTVTDGGASRRFR